MTVYLTNPDWEKLKALTQEIEAIALDPEMTEENKKTLVSASRVALEILETKVVNKSQKAPKPPIPHPPPAPKASNHPKPPEPKVSTGNNHPKPPAPKPTSNVSRKKPAKKYYQWVWIGIATIGVVVVVAIIGLETIATIIGFALAGCLIISLLSSITERKEKIAADYVEAKDALRANPKDPALRQVALQAGRNFYAELNGGYITAASEAAILNDLEACTKQD